MDPLDILRLAMFAGAAIVWLIYVIEAFRDRPEQGLLTLLLPGYVLYYACIRSPHGVGMRLALAVFLAAFVII